MTSPLEKQHISRTMNTGLNCYEVQFKGGVVRYIRANDQAQCLEKCKMLPPDFKNPKINGKVKEDAI